MNIDTIFLQVEKRLPKSLAERTRTIFAHLFGKNLFYMKITSKIKNKEKRSFLHHFLPRKKSCKKRKIKLKSPPTIVL